MNCNNTTVKANSVVNANVANDRNSKINFAKASIKRCKFIFCNLSNGLCGLGTLFANLLFGIVAFLRQQVLKFADHTKRQVQHYYILYWLRKRGGIYYGKYLTILQKLSFRGEGRALTIKLRILMLFVLLSGAFLSSGNVTANERNWFEDFDGAMYVARTSGKNLLIYFSAEGNNESAQVAKVANTGLSNGSKSVRNRDRGQLSSLSYICGDFERNVFESESIVELMDQFVLLKLPTDTKVLSGDGTEVSIIELPMFKEMVGLPGLAIIDFEDYDAAYYGEVIGVLPFINSTSPNQFQTTTFLTIPSCKLTQRTLTYAVRIHPDRPLSADGEIEPTLMAEATEHAAYQAKNRVLGHQNFSARSSRVRAALGESMSEVCAQSGSYNGHFEAALACVRGWRGSPAHWRSVRAKQKYFAYDMVQSSNGLWYATGLFVDR